MGKWIKVAVAALVGLALIVGVVGTAMAQTPTPTTPGAGSAWCGGWGMGFGGILDSIAGMLGLTRDQVVDQRQDGKSLADIAKSAPKPADETALINAIVAERQKIVDQRIADGSLTKEQGALIMERSREQAKAMVEGTPACANGAGYGPGYGMRGGRGGGFGGGCGMGGWGNQGLRTQ